jgi:hypothetical protein
VYLGNHRAGRRHSGLQPFRVACIVQTGLF